MSLIKCSECGREISDKAVSCPGCGCPISQAGLIKNKSDLEKQVDEIYHRNTDRVKAIKELREATGMDLKSAMNIMDIKYKGKTFKEELKEKKLENRENLQSSLYAIQGACNIITGKGKVACCPKCHSTSISYDTKKLSLGRAAVGGAVAGAPGAVLGGLSSKKGYAVCLKCGKRWKI